MRARETAESRHADYPDGGGKSGEVTVSNHVARLRGVLNAYKVVFEGQLKPNGQFRTPRHIIKMMVDMMQPTLQDSVCDPAMGSAGFIVESAKYVQEHYKKELLKP